MQNSEIYIWSDGAARGNPGPAGIGFVIKNENGAKLAEHHSFIGVSTNNIAEYRALIGSLEFVQKLKAVDKVNIFLDSELVVKQISGAYKVKNQGLKPLYLKAMELLKGLNFNMKHISREKNIEADRLANKAIDEGSSGSRGFEQENDRLIQEGLF